MESLFQDEPDVVQCALGMGREISEFPCLSCTLSRNFQSPHWNSQRLWQIGFLTWTVFLSFDVESNSYSKDANKRGPINQPLTTHHRG